MDTATAVKPRKSRVVNLLQQIAGRIVWMVIGAVVSLWVQPQVKSIVNTHFVRPVEYLQEADDLRATFKQSAILQAIEKYKSVAASYPSYQSAAFRGISRASSDLAFLRFRLGLSLGNSPEEAFKAAASANLLDKSVESRIAAIYAEDSYELFRRDSFASYPTSSEEQVESATKRKIIELKMSNPQLDPAAALDIKYLAWRSGMDKNSDTFPDGVTFTGISNIRILIDVAVHYLDILEDVDKPEGDPRLDRAQAICQRLHDIAPANAMAEYCLGRAKVLRKDYREAQRHYEAAISNGNETSFPRVLNNLGITFSEKHGEQPTHDDLVDALDTFNSARKAFEVSQNYMTIILDNVAQMNLELGKVEEACQVWQAAAELPSANRDFVEDWGLAQCAYMTNNPQIALQHFEDAIQHGKPRNLLDIRTYQRWHACPKEREIALALMKMYQIHAARPH